MTGTPILAPRVGPSIHDGRDLPSERDRRRRGDVAVLDFAIQATENGRSDVLGVAGEMSSVLREDLESSTFSVTLSVASDREV